MRLVFEMSAKDLAMLGIAVIVENWDKYSARYGSGSKKRRYKAEFTDKERRVLAAHHAMFYRWTMVVGFPDTHVFRRLETIELIKKAANFFATI